MPALMVAFVAASISIAAQNGAPALTFDAANPLTLPDDIYLGEVGGVATSSRGDIYVYTRTGHPTQSMATARPFAHGGSRLFQFDRNGRFTREIGAGRVRLSVCRAGARRSAGQHLGGRRAVGDGDEVRSARAVSRSCSDARPRRSTTRRARAAQGPAGEGGGGRGGGRAQARVLRRMSSIVRPTSPGTHKATSLWPMDSATPASRSSTRMARS
jgi:hypothetical protein